MTEFAGLDKARIQLVARAVAAFNHQRKKAGLPPLEEKGVCPLFSETLKVMPAILMAGTFLQNPSHRNTVVPYSQCGNGTYPPCETHVTYCYSTVDFRRRHEGMKPLDNHRLEILKCYEAFKVFVGEE